MVKRLLLVFILLSGVSSAGEKVFPYLGVMETHDGKKVRTAHWTHTTIAFKGKIVFLQGMGEFIERNQLLAENLAKRGFDVFSFDWRGQGASTRGTSISSLCHVADFSDYLVDFKKYMKEIIGDQPVIVIGNSMGGHLALRYAHDNPHAFKAIVLIAPMVEIKTRSYPRMVVGWVASAFVMAGHGERFVFGERPFNAGKCQELYSRNAPECIRPICQALSQNPQLASGGPSFGWLNAAFESIKILQEPGYADSISVPTLLMSAGEDHLVDNEAQTDLCQKMSHCRQIIFPKAKHSILLDQAQIRNRLYDELFKFID
jgi:lysophospholipase